MCVCVCVCVYRLRYQPPMEWLQEWLGTLDMHLAFLDGEVSVHKHTQTHTHTHTHSLHTMISMPKHSGHLVSAGYPACARVCLCVYVCVCERGGRECDVMYCVCVCVSAGLCSGRQCLSSPRRTCAKHRLVEQIPGTGKDTHTHTYTHKARVCIFFHIPGSHKAS